VDVQWFPGHMASARRDLTEALSRNDVLIEVLDARLPQSSHNPLIAQLASHRRRPCLKVLNKKDLADPRITRQWLTHLNKEQGVRAISLCAHKAGEAAAIPGECRRLAPHREGPGKTLRLLVAGVPNVGKSTLINTLLKVRRAGVGDEPALTRRQHCYDLKSGVSLTDTPGLLWPKIEDQSTGQLLAASRAIGVNAYIAEQTAAFLADRLALQYPRLLQQRYKLPDWLLQQADGDALLVAVAKARRVMRAGLPDESRAAQILLQDFRTGKLGRISMESPPGL